MSALFEPLDKVGQLATVRDVRIAGVATCLPSREVDNAEFVTRFGQKAVDDVTKMIGVHARRQVDVGTTTSDLCFFAAQALLEKLKWDASTVNVLIFVSQTPDYQLPATACALATRLGMPSGVIAFDINLGCSAYPYALWLGMTILASGTARRVILAVGDTVSRIVDPEDRATAMLFGDAGSATALESGGNNKPSFFVLGSDGNGERHLMVPKSGQRQFVVGDDPRLTDRNAACLYMDGPEVFNFTLKAVPKLFKALISASGEIGADWDAVLMHQANLFMLKHLTKKCGLTTEQVPVNIELYGNTSCASIPLLLCTTLSYGQRPDMRVAMMGFGVGFSWAGAVINIDSDIPLICINQGETR